MSDLTRKFIAVLMLLWLPLSSGSALAASMSMQLQRGGCMETATMQSMAHEDMAGHHQHHEQAPAAADTQDNTCNDCGVCHLACTGYLAVPSTEVVAAQATELETTPYLVVFHSFTSAPLVPPPLARA
jgi:membrane protease subunit (stomatin/prohibitin family)